MLCRRPYIGKGGMPFPCGQCMPCRINKRRIWTHRILLESNLYADNSFWTLTYDDDHLPRLEDGRGILVPRDMQLFLKRLRKMLEPHRFRFFGVGEYGDDTGRPHYHLVLFNFPPCQNGRTVDPYSGKSCCACCDQVKDSWQQGAIYGGDLTRHSAQYVAGYVCKKMTAADDPRLKGRPPEFARMSNRPGIGADFMHEVASVRMQFDRHLIEEDVPMTLRHGDKELPLGRYLRRKLRVLEGRDEKTPQEVLDRYIETVLRPLQDTAQARANEEAPHNTVAYGQFYREELYNVDAGKVERMEARQRIFKKRRKL